MMSDTFSSMFDSRFQTFDDPARPAEDGERLAALREALARRALHGFIVPRTDAYQSEYVPPCDERLAWLTGFTGSAGTAIILPDRAALFVDGRYTVQACQQVDGAAYELVDVMETPPARWLEQALQKDQALGIDPWLHTLAELERLEKACAKAGARLVRVDGNPLDLIWTDRPPAPHAPVVLHPLARAGEDTPSKLDRLRDRLNAAGADILLLTDPHNIAWTFNIRGGDVAHTPVALARALLPREGKPQLFLARGKLSDEVRTALEQVADVADPEAIDQALDRLKGQGVLLDPKQTPVRLADRLQAAGATIIRKDDPVTALKAVKNGTEITGARAAQARDAVALARFLAWFDRTAPTGTVTEILAAEALETFRRDTGALKDISFPTISAAGPNAALPHYRVTTASNRTVEPGFFLIDSGGQYEDGTTDVTRTIVVGEANGDMRDRFTRVLKGHIAIALTHFPKGTTGAHLDVLARRPLWEIGADFDHGTGHGVGSYLSVHEGPQRISKLGHVALEPGMILSNEPGYYREGHYGIRLENLILVTPVDIPGGERPMLGFETLTLAPFDRRAIAPDLLTREEWQWLDAYHARVLAEVGPHLDETDRAWLEQACAPL